jgi:two-component system phosphate regulon sensor histidine kinase PhoR
MGKKMFVLIVFLMSVSLIGIIAVQLYWINNAVESRKEQFKNDVQKSLGSVAERINEKERSLFDKKFEGILESAVLANKAQIKSLFFQEIDTTNQQKISFGSTILEENIEIPAEFLGSDSIIFKRVTGKKDFFQSRLIKGPDNLFSAVDEKRYSNTKRLINIENSQFAEYFKDYNVIKPIHQRVSNRELNETIKDELNKRNITLDFKYGVYSIDGLATKLKSGYYTINKKDSYAFPLFFDADRNHWA